MKKLFLLLNIMTAFALLSCSRVIDEEVETAAGKENNVRILTRAQDEIHYPVTLYAFSSEADEVVAQTVAASASETLDLALPAGHYRLVALSGSEGYSLSSSPTLDDVIAMEDDCASQPLQMGTADVEVTQHTSVSLTMYYQVASVDLSLTDIPSEVTAVCVTLSPLRNTLTFGGTYDGSTAVTVSLSRQTDGTWTTPRFYTFPGASSRLTLSISLTRANSEQVYAYVCDCTLEAGTPYVLSGSYAQGFSVNGVVNAAGWNAAKEITFNFGTNAGSEEEKGDEETPVTGTIPEAGTLWNGHIVGAVENVTENDAELLLLSRDEWQGVCSAYNEEYPGQAQTAVDSYTEDDLTGWSIPTTDEAKAIRTAIGNTLLATTNTFLASVNYTPLSDNMEDAEGNMVRYLCQSAERAFTWNTATSNSVSKAGKKRTYYLRAVKRVTVTRE